MGFSEIAELDDFKRSLVFWDGCRVIAYDERDELYKYGVVWNYDENSPHLNILVDGAEVKTIRAFRNPCYKSEDWTEHKPVKSLGKIDARSFRSAEAAPEPPEYFNRRIPLKGGLPFARGVWIWAEKNVFAKYEGKRMDMPKIGVTKDSSKGGVWYPKERTLLTNIKANSTYRRFFTNITHEMCHQYATVVDRMKFASQYDAHGEHFLKLAAFVNRICGISIDTQCDMNDFLVKPGEHKLKDKTGIDHDMTTPSKLKFWMIILQKQGNDQMLYGVRVSNEMKGLELTTRLNNSGYVAAMYEARFKVFETFSSASSFDKKFFNNLSLVSGALVELLAEHGEFVSDNTLDVIKRYIRNNPNYKDQII